MGKSERQQTTVSTHVAQLDALHEVDNELLASLGYKSEFKREFSVSKPLLVRMRATYKLFYW